MAAYVSGKDFGDLVVAELERLGARDAGQVLVAAEDDPAAAEEAPVDGIEVIAGAEIEGLPEGRVLVVSLSGTDRKDWREGLLFGTVVVFTVGLLVGVTIARFSPKLLAEPA